MGAYVTQSQVIIYTAPISKLLNIHDLVVQKYQVYPCSELGTLLDVNHCGHGFQLAGMSFFPLWSACAVL